MVQNDFFISYSSTDLRWAEWIASQLEDAGYSTFLQAWDFRPGFNYIQMVHDAVQTAKRMILVLSPDYLQEIEQHPEWSTAFLRHVQGQKGAFIPICVRDCTLTGLLAPIIPISLVEIHDAEAARQKVLAGIAIGRARPTLSPLFPGARPVERQIPDPIENPPIIYPYGSPPIYKAAHLFFAYAKKDEALARRLEKHLSMLQRQRVIKTWAKWMLQPGQAHEQVMHASLEQANIILLLLSADFLSSHECRVLEQRAVEKATLKMSHVLPIIVRPIDWEHCTLAAFSPLPTQGKPVTSWKNQDEAFVSIVQGIRSIVNEIVKE
jgi:TIR domain